MAGRKEIPRELSIYINDKLVVNSFRGISAEISRTSNEMKNLNKNSETYDEDLKKLKGDLSLLKDKQQEFKKEIDGTSEAMDGVSESWSKLKNGLLSGDLKSAKEGFLGLKEGLGGLITTARAFIATPLGAAIAVISGIVIGTKAVFDFNQELEKSNDVLRSFGLSGKEMSNVRSEIQATAETFDKEFGDLASKANSLAKTYGISMSEANDIIAQGLANGGALNGEFLDSIGEYDEFFVKAGYSAQEFINVLNKGFDVGIYSDKLPDALKEADLSLKEQTKATRDALENAFGATFSDDILARVAAGKTTTKDALIEIAAEAEKTGLSQQAQAQLTADVFKGAGEDAGGALKILQVVGQTAQSEISASTKAQLELLAANEKLNKAQAELFEIEGFGGMWDVIKAKAISAFADMLTYISDLKKDIQPLIDFVGVALVNAFVYAKLTITTAFDVLGTAVKLFFNTVKFVFNLIKAVITGDFKGAITLVGDYFKSMGNTIVNFFAKIKNNIINAVQGIISGISPILEALGIDVDKLQKKLESFKSKEIVIKTTNENESGKPTKTPEELAEEERLLQEALAKQKAIRDAARAKEEEARKRAAEKKKAEEEKAAKEELDRIIALAKAKTDVARAELNLYIATERSKIDTSKALTPEIIAEETNRLDRIKERQVDAFNEDRIAKNKKAEADAKSDEEFALTKYANDVEYETQRQNLEFGFMVATDELKKQYTEEQKALADEKLAADKVLAAEQLAAENELALLEADGKYEQDRIKQQQEYQKQLADYKKLFDDKKITESEYIRFKDAAEKQQAEIDRQREISKVNASLNAFGQLAGALGELFGQSKELAITQAGINGALAITSILSAPSMGNPILDAAVKAVQIAAAVVTVAAQVKQITKAKAPKQPKFFYGGFTGSTPHYGHDEFGPMTGIVHDQEYVIPKAMTQSPRYANTIAWLENERTGKTTRKFADGGETSPGTIPANVMVENNSEMTILLRAVLYRLENPIAPNLVVGYDSAKAIQDLNNESASSDQNGVVSS